MTARHRLSRAALAALPVRSEPEILLGAQLEQAGIPFEAEFRFHPSRKWRLDVAFPYAWLAVEIDGGGFVGGRHSRGMGLEADAEKHSAAVIRGWRVLRATPRQVEDGRCLSWVKQFMHLEPLA